MSPDLAELLMRCLAKQPEQRPPSAEALDQALAACASAGTWTLQDAEKWWQSNMGSFEPLPATTMAEKTLVIAPRPVAHDSICFKDAYNPWPQTPSAGWLPP